MGHPLGWCGSTNRDAGNDLSKKTILVIDDDEAVFLYLRKKPDHLYDLITTTEPAGALALALREKPDLILYNIDMQRLNGGDMSGIFFECEATWNIPFAYLTSLLSPSDLLGRGCQIGAHSGVSKAAPVAEMVEAIERLLQVDCPSGAAKVVR